MSETLPAISAKVNGEQLCTFFLHSRGEKKERKKAEMEQLQDTQRKRKMEGLKRKRERKSNASLNRWPINLLLVAANHLCVCLFIKQVG